MTEQLTTIELEKQNMKFSAAHFTIFSATEREHLHGHNYTVHCALTTRVKNNGLSFDYRFYKTVLYNLCQKLHQTTLLAANSQYLRFEDHGDYLDVYFNNQRIPFLKSDTTMVPISNITVEELSKWFIQQLILDQTTLNTHNIEKIVVKVYSGPGQSGSCTWVKE